MDMDRGEPPSGVVVTLIGTEEVQDTSSWLPSSFVEYTLAVAPHASVGWEIKARYSQFHDLLQQLEADGADTGRLAALLPQKTLLLVLEDDIQERINMLPGFLSALLQPEYESQPAVRRFLLLDERRGALSIQRVRRGMVGRRRASQARELRNMETEAAIFLQAFRRGEAARREHNPRILLRRESATKLQASFRGCCYRRRKAATAIQRFRRGHICRQRCRLQVSAALRIQQAHRLHTWSISTMCQARLFVVETVCVPSAVIGSTRMAAAIRFAEALGTMRSNQVRRYCQSEQFREGVRRARKQLKEIQLEEGAREAQAMDQLHKTLQLAKSTEEIERLLAQARSDLIDTGIVQQAKFEPLRKTHQHRVREAREATEKLERAMEEGASAAQISEAIQSAVESNHSKLIDFDILQRVRAKYETQRATDERERRRLTQKVGGATSSEELQTVVAEAEQVARAGNTVVEQLLDGFRVKLSEMEMVERRQREEGLKQSTREFWELAQKGHSHIEGRGCICDECQMSKPSEEFAMHPLTTECRHSLVRICLRCLGVRLRQSRVCPHASCTNRIGDSKMQEVQGILDSLFPEIVEAHIDGTHALQHMASRSESVTVWQLNGKCTEITFGPRQLQRTSVAQLKAAVQQETGLKPAEQRLVCNNTELKVSKDLLSSYGVVAGSKINLLVLMFAASEVNDVSFQLSWGYPEQTRPSHFVFCLDKSGSMRGQPWIDLIDAYRAFLQIRLQAGAQDLVSVVTFDHHSRLLAEAVSVDEALQLVIQEPLRGGTNFGNAIKKAEEVLTASSDIYTSVLVFMSDGRPQHGGPDWNVVERIKASRSRVHTVAFGSSADKDVLQEMAVRSSGTFHAAADGVALAREFENIANIDYLDGTCLLFSDKRTEPVICDFLQTEPFDGVRHTGDMMTRERGSHGIGVKLKEIPRQYTRAYFILSAWGSGTIQQFKRPTLRMTDTLTGEQLCEGVSDSVAAGGTTSSAQALILCGVFRDEADGWLVLEVDMPSQGNARDYSQIVATCCEQWDFF